MNTPYPSPIQLVAYDQSKLLSRIIVDEELTTHLQLRAVRHNQKDGKFISEFITGIDIAYLDSNTPIVISRLGGVWGRNFGDFVCNLLLHSETEIPHNTEAFLISDDSYWDNDPILLSANDVRELCTGIIIPSNDLTFEEYFAQYQIPMLTY